MGVIYICPNLDRGDTPSVWKGEVGRINLPMIKNPFLISIALLSDVWSKRLYGQLKGDPRKEGIDVKAKLKKSCLDKKNISFWLRREQIPDLAKWQGVGYPMATKQRGV